MFFFLPIISNTHPNARGVLYATISSAWVDTPGQSARGVDLVDQDADDRVLVHGHALAERLPGKAVDRDA